MTIAVTRSGSSRLTPSQHTPPPAFAHNLQRISFSRAMQVLPRHPSSKQASSSSSHSPASQLLPCPASSSSWAAQPCSTCCALSSLQKPSGRPDWLPAGLLLRQLTRHGRQRQQQREQRQLASGVEEVQRRQQQQRRRLSSRMTLLACLVLVP